MTRLVIGLSGVAGSGKSTAARILSTRYGFARKPFAYPLKAMIAALGVGADILDGNNAAKELPLDLLHGRSARHAMQQLGDWGRNQMAPDFWVATWKRNIDLLHGVPVVADDCRYANEARAIRDLGGVIIRLWRVGSGTKINPEHSSEQANFGPDVLIDNNGLEADLEASLGRVIDQLREPQWERAANG